jgi:hypothetical protein
MAVNGGGCHGLRSTCYSPWRPAVDGLLLSAWVVNPMAMCHNLAAPETTIDAIGKWGLVLLSSIIQVTWGGSQIAFNLLLSMEASG